MTEILVRIGVDGNLELIDEKSQRIGGADHIEPMDAAWLARALLACAAALCGQSPPAPGSIGGDAHLPIIQSSISHSNITGDPVLVLTVPPGIQLTFVMSPEAAKQIGTALIEQGGKKPLLAGHRGTAH